MHNLLRMFKGLGFRKTQEECKDVMPYYPIGSKLYLPDGRIGTVTGINQQGQYELWPDDPTDDEFLLNIHTIVNVGEENPVLYDISW